MVTALDGITLQHVPGLQVGHATDPEGITGCTVVMAVGGATAGVDVRGSAPGTRETDLLRPTAVVARVHAICLAGGSAFGLAAADGVMRYLAERGVGFETAFGPVPIVPAAVVFDLDVGSREAYPGPEMGYRACQAAQDGHGPLEGSLGAGTGATVGKLGGPGYRPSKGGVGSAGMRLEDGTIVAALAVTNAVGNVIGHDGRTLAGTRDAAGRLQDADELALWRTDLALFGRSTTLAVVGTDGDLDRAGCRKVAEMSHDALALAVRPVHTMWDGDTTFVLSTGARAADVTQVGLAAVHVLRRAIERSVLTAQGRGSIVGLADGEARD
ncbi:MAG: P1 family peptidase [Chloroflexota bacterium]|nr:P1 family peptidase [Chloroflexota bacterium]